MAKQKAIEAVGDQRESLLAFGLKHGDLDPITRYLVSLRILRDLMSQGWGMRSDDQGLILDPPGADEKAAPGPDPERKKEALRHSFSFARESQFAQPATGRGRGHVGG